MDNDVDPEYESFTFEEFAGELTHIDFLPPRIEEVMELNNLSSINDSSFENFTVVDTSISFLSKDKIFEPGILPSYNTDFGEILKESLKDDDWKKKKKVVLTLEDFYEFDLAIVIMIFLPFLTYSIVSLILYSTRSEDVVFDPGIFICWSARSICSPKNK